MIMKKIQTFLPLLLALVAICTNTQAQGRLAVGDTITLGEPVGADKIFNYVYQLTQRSEWGNTFNKVNQLRLLRDHGNRNIGTIYIVDRIIAESKVWEDQETKGFPDSESGVIRLTNIDNQYIHLFVRLDLGLKSGEIRKGTVQPPKQTLTTREGRVFSTGDTITIGINTGNGEYNFVFNKAGDWNWLEKTKNNLSGRKFTIERLINGNRRTQDWELDEFLFARDHFKSNSIAKITRADFHFNVFFVDLDHGFIAGEIISDQKLDARKLTLKNGQTITEGDTITIGKMFEENDYWTVFSGNRNFWGDLDFNNVNRDLTCHQYTVTRLIPANIQTQDRETKNFRFQNRANNVAKIKSLHDGAEYFVAIDDGIRINEIFLNPDCPEILKDFQKWPLLMPQDAFLAFMKLSKLNIDTLTNYYISAFKRDDSQKNEFERREIFRETKDELQDELQATSITELANTTYSIIVRKDLAEYDFTRGGFDLVESQWRSNENTEFGKNNEFEIISRLYYNENVWNYDILPKSFNYNLLNFPKFSFFKMEERRAGQFLKEQGHRTIWVKYDFKIDTAVPATQTNFEYLLPIRIIRATVFSQRNLFGELGVIE